MHTSMKKIISFLSAIAAMFAMTACSWFTLDNDPSWNAQIEGRLIDSETNEPVQSEQGKTISVYEQDWDNEVAQYWAIKNNGTYKNTLVFAGKYIMRAMNTNFLADDQPFTLQKGANTVDFKVTPFVRIDAPDVTYDLTTKKIKAKFKVSTSLSEDQVNNIGNIWLCVYPDRFVCASANNCADDPGAKMENFDPRSNEVITLEVDTQLDANAAEFQYDRPHFVRIAAVGGHYAGMPAYDEDLGTDWDRQNEATVELLPDYSNFWEWMASIPHKIVHHDASYRLDGTVNANAYYNYSPVYKVDLKTGTVTEVTDW